MTDLRRSLLDRAKGYEQEAAKTQGTLSAYWRGVAQGLAIAADLMRSDEHRLSVETFRDIAATGARGGL
jgi:hypothetical protein